MRNFLFITVTSFLTLSSFAQQPDTLFQKIDSLSRIADSAGGQINRMAPGAYNEASRITIPGFLFCREVT